MNGACEWNNGVLEQYPRCYINYQQDNWTDLLLFVEVAYNNLVHSSTIFTPFKVASEQDFVAMSKLSQIKPQISSLAEWVAQLQSTWPIDFKALDCKAWETYKKQTDKKCTKSKDSKVGDKVYLSAKYCNPFNNTKSSDQNTFPSTSSSTP